MFVNFEFVTVARPLSAARMTPPFERLESWRPSKLNVPVEFEISTPRCAKAAPPLMITSEIVTTPGAAIPAPSVIPIGEPVICRWLTFVPGWLATIAGPIGFVMIG